MKLMSNSAALKKKKKKCSEAVVLYGRGGSVQNLLRGSDPTQLAYFGV